MIIPQPPGSPRRGGWMQTYRGGGFYPNDPQPHEIFVEDIAHALSMQCRYGGHCERHYSTAEHSYWMSYMVPERVAYEALMHDWPEAYLIDVPTAEKKLLKPQYQMLEAAWWEAGRRRLGLPAELAPEVAQADADILLSERDFNMKRPPGPWSTPECGYRVRIKCWPAPKAEKMFLLRFLELNGEPLVWHEKLLLAMNRIKYLEVPNNKKLQKETKDAPYRYRCESALG